jgi:hypothetical protein
MILVKGGHGFSNNCRSICVNHFLMSKSEFLCMPYKLCWCVSRNWLCDSKKGAGRPIVRTKEVKEVVDDIL